MSQVRPDIDLDALSRNPATVERPRRRWLRIVVPLAILLAFGGILVWSLGDVLRPAVEVTVLRPRAASGSAGAPMPGSIALQAAGWIEPNPFPTTVTALTSGVVREVLVQESDRLHAGDPVARLVDDGQKLALRAAEASLEKAQAEAAKAEVEAKNARASFDAAIEVTEGEASAKAELDGKRQESIHRRASIVQGEAQLRVAADELRVQQELAKDGAAGPRAVELATARVDEARGGLEMLKASAAITAADVGKAEARHARATAEKTLRLADRLRLDTSAASVALATAAVHEAEAQLATARLRLERTTVRAPTDGIVLERLVAPGTVLEGGEAGGLPVCSLYDPTALRVRVDVPQTDISKVRIGQRAEVLSEVRAGQPYQGEVIRILQKADIQKVTLQVHVKILDGDGLLRPEMLCQVRFRAPDAPAADSRTTGTLTERLLIPERLLLPDGSVWVVDPTSQTAVRRPVEAGARGGENVEIRAGINLTDKLIDQGRDRIAEGAHVRVRGGN